MPIPRNPGIYYIRSTALPTEAPLILKKNAISEADFAKLVTCVSVIDETGGSYYNNLGNLNAIWAQNPPVIGGAVDSRRGFRTAFPYRSFYILDPGGGGSIDIPTNFSGDANAYGPITVNRDGGDAGSRSDWFSICNFGSLPYGTIVSIWIDISGSMTLATVQASYDYFIARCAAAGIEIVLSLSASGERYIDGHIQYLPPSANFTATDEDGNTSNIQVIAGAPITLSWVVFGDVNTLVVDYPGNTVQASTSNFQNFVKTVTVNPTVPTTYTLSADGPAGTTTRTIFIDVLVPPTITLESTNGLTLNAGQCTIIRWTPAGDYASLAWTQGPLTNTNAESEQQDCPDDTITYCAVLSGPGGVSPETCLTITVRQIPTTSITSPSAIDYGENFNITYTSKYADVSITITPTYTYTNGTTATGTVITRTAATSNQASDPDSDTVRDGTVPITVSYNTIGPASISFVISAVGNGGSATDSDITTVVIDRTPENFNIEESEDLLKDQVPVITPESVILSEFYEINDIDIPVEVKADWPINVDINQQNNWQKVRQI